MQWKPKERKGNNTYIRHNRFTSKTVTSDKEGHYIMIKESIHQEDRTIVNIYTPTKTAPKHIKEILRNIQGEIDNNAVIVGYFNTSLSTMDRSSRQKIN